MGQSTVLHIYTVNIDLRYSHDLIQHDSFNGTAWCLVAAANNLPKYSGGAKSDDLRAVLALLLLLNFKVPSAFFWNSFAFNIRVAVPRHYISPVVFIKSIMTFDLWSEALYCRDARRYDNSFNFVLLGCFKHKLDATHSRPNEVLMISWIINWNRGCCMNYEVTSLHGLVDRVCIGEIGIKELNGSQFFHKVLLKRKHFRLVVLISNCTSDSILSCAFSVQELIQNLWSQVPRHTCDKDERFSWFYHNLL